MKRTSFYLLLLMNLMLFCDIQTYAQDIYRLINPVSGGSKSPSDGPPFLRFDGVQQYYHITSFPANHFNDVTASFAKWNNAGTVQFSSSSFTGLYVTIYWDDHRNPNGIINHGKHIYF